MTVRQCRATIRLAEHLRGRMEAWCKSIECNDLETRNFLHKIEEMSPEELIDKWASFEQ